ncbi:MAG: CinA family protein [bacterium]|nr:CinA family protein [bacterium]
MDFKNIIHKLQLKQLTIATMESCTGGGVANAITNMEGASEIFKFSAVTYCNEYKIKMGVDKEIIDKYTVYSIETAMSMAKAISNFANSNYGVGVTGKLNRKDENNDTGSNNLVYISIYSKDEDKFYNEEVTVNKKARFLNKKIVINKIIEMMATLLKDIN